MVRLGLIVKSRVEAKLPPPMMRSWAAIWSELRPGSGGRLQPMYKGEEHATVLC